MSRIINPMRMIVQWADHFWIDWWINALLLLLLWRRLLLLLDLGRPRPFPRRFRRFIMRRDVLIVMGRIMRRWLLQRGAMDDF